HDTLSKHPGVAVKHPDLTSRTAGWSAPAAYDALFALETRVSRTQPRFMIHMITLVLSLGKDNVMHGFGW
ncbi:MAG TPA: hypothetical protein VGM53_20945, partial [Streptosporangiaceae bacterium]